MCAFETPRTFRIPAGYRPTPFAKWHHISYIGHRSDYTMTVLEPIDTRPPPFAAAPISDEEGAALFRAAANLFRAWQLSDVQAAALLDLPVRTYARWKAEGPGRLDRDKKARLSNLMGIHKALRIIFREPQRAYAWIRAAMEGFGGKPALDIMLGGELTDLMRVRRYLDAERGGW